MLRTLKKSVRLVSIMIDKVLTFIIYQYVTLAICSSRLYHMLDKTIKLGWQAASKIPKSVRTVTRPVKFTHTEWSAKTVPHKTMLMPRYFAIGTR